MILWPYRLFITIGILGVLLAWLVVPLFREQQGDGSTPTSGTISRLGLMENPQRLLDIDDALVSDSNPARNDGSLDYERCARLHNYLVAYSWMAYHQRDAQDLVELLIRPSFFERPRDDSEFLRGRLDPGLISYLESIIMPKKGLSYWVENVQVTPADKYFFSEDNDLDGKERFVALYGSWLEHGGHNVGLVYDQQRHQVAMTLVQENIESVEPIDKHLDMWVPLETMLTNWIYMIRIGKVTSGPERAWGDGEGSQLGAWIWQPYSPAQVDSAVAAIERLYEAIEARMPSGSLLPVISEAAPLLTDEDLDAASVPQNCFIRSVLTRVKTPRFKHIAPGLEIPHDAARFVSQQQFTGLEPSHDDEGNKIIPSVLIFAAADKRRTVGFNKEIRRTFVTPNDLEPNILYKDGHPILTGLYSEYIRRGDCDIAEEGFRLLLPFGLRSDYSESEYAPRRSDGSFVDAGSYTQLFQFGGFHPFGREWRAQRLEKLMDRWRKLVESGIWSVGREGVQGSIDVFADAERGAWRDYWIEPEW
uniref:S-adenosylmethionine synthase n=1 Tax=Talaromyces marneffei PM1 TaxID=1077442 RepID=A0A093VAB0_TALMA